MKSSGENIFDSNIVHLMLLIDLTKGSQWCGGKHCMHMEFVCSNLTWAPSGLKVSDLWLEYYGLQIRSLCGSNMWDPCRIEVD